MLTVPQVAEILDRDISMVRRWCQQGLIAGAFKLGRDWVIPDNIVTAVRHRKKIGDWFYPAGAEIRQKRKS